MVGQRRSGSVSDTPELSRPSQLSLQRRQNSIKLRPTEYTGDPPAHSPFRCSMSTCTVRIYIKCIVRISGLRADSFLAEPTRNAVEEGVLSQPYLCEYAIRQNSRMHGRKLHPSQVNISSNISAEPPEPQVGSRTSPVPSGRHRFVSVSREESPEV